MEESDTILGQISDLERLIIKDNVLVDSGGKKVKILKYGQSYVYKVSRPIKGLTREYLESLGRVPIVYHKWANAVYVGLPYDEVNFAYASVQDFHIEK